jgi:hypothetical protein
MITEITLTNDKINAEPAIKITKNASARSKPSPLRDVLPISNRI